MSEQQRHRRRRDDDENLAYGEDYGQNRGYGDRGGGNRSLVGDAFNKIRTKVDQYSNRPSTDQYGYSSSSNPQQSQQYNQSYGQSNYQSGYQDPQQGQYQNPSPGPGQSAYAGGTPSQSGRPQQKQDFTDKLFTGLQGAVQSIGTDVAGLLGTKYDSHHQNYTGSQAQYGAQGQYGPSQAVPRNRFDSFVRDRGGNDVKWYVDGCSYFWAVSEALERARESIWILDWWLSPELYLRRPPAANEDWRLDRVLQRVANRGVKINVIVYKEVTQALTLSSSHTKHALEALSPNIGVFRHPDHLPDSQTTHSSIVSAFQGLKLDAAGASKLGADALRGIYGLNDDVILYWAHHEKLCIIDKNLVFMGGLDMCFGRWDTNQHSISDAHPSDLNKIVFPGQDFNNARVMDFNDVAQPFQNKLDRTKSSRMGWSDISICLRGACVQDLCHHFTDRWNFIYDEKYNVRTDVRYSRLPPWSGHHSSEGPQPTSGAASQQNLQPGQFPPPPSSQGYTPPPWQATTSNQPRPTTPQQGGRPYSPQPPTGQYNQAQQQHGSRPHTPNPTSGQYSSSQQQTNFPPPPPGPAPQQSQQTYPPPPPPPPGGPPQPAAQAQPSWSAHDQYSQGPATSQSSNQPQSQYGSGYQSSSNPSQTSQPSQPTQPTQPSQQPYSSDYQSTQSTQSSQSLQPYQSQYTSSYQPTQQSQSPQPPQPPQPQYTPDDQHSSQSQQQPQGPQQPYDHNYQQQVQSPPPQQSQYPSDYQRTQSPQVPQQQYSTEHQQSHPSSQYTPYAQELPSSQSPHQNYGASGSTRSIEESSDYYGPDRGSERGPGGGDRFAQYRSEGRKLGAELGNIGSMIGHRVEDKFFTGPSGRPSTRSGGPMQCQLIRSCTKWSNGSPTEHSIQNAYIDVIMNSQHFVYIENQFFITATGDKQGPVKNQIGRALVDRILRAARNRERYHVIIVIPAIPAFAGDFVDDQSLGTRAICEFQYNSICRGGQSIMEKVAEAGFNPMDYIRFYNLRNYDRINFSATLLQAQTQSGVSYEDARKQEEQMLGAGYAGQGYSGYGPGQQQQQYGSNPVQQYQSAAHNVQSSPADQWDSVASCYMLNGQDIRTVPWSGPPEAELDAFVSEELYIHSKVMIADDRVVICGSANLNDRSMLGTHDSEIALFINDPTPVPSTMAGRQYSVSRFATSLRRQLFRKHLGLIPAQDPTRPNDNFYPLGPPNTYDWGSPEDRIVSDPLSDTFLALWNTRARTNTEVYRKAFRAVPDDYVRSWSEYKEFYEYYFHRADAEASGKDQHDRRPARVEYGHVVREDFPGGASQLKEQLSKVKGTLVEMPLCFLQNEDIAKQGLTLNALTEPLYT